MALLHGMHRVRELRSRHWQLHAAHLDHHIPANASEMLTFVRDASETLGIPFHGEAVDVPALSATTGESIEEAGRKARYEFLECICAETNANALALAHHADDQAETVLHRILRGTGLRGLAGIPESRPLSGEMRTLVIRPLLPMRRADCIAYLQYRNLAFMHDATNDDIHAATRNRIRHALLPTIERDINPQATVAVVRLAEQASAANDVIDEIAAALLNRCQVEQETHETIIDAAAFQAGHPFVQAAALRLAIERLGGTLREIGYERLLAAISVVLGDRANSLTELPDGTVVERRGRFIHIRVRVELSA